MKVRVSLNPDTVAKYVNAVASYSAHRGMSFLEARAELDYSTASATGCKLSAEQFAACLATDINTLMEVSSDYAVVIDIAPIPLKTRHVDSINRVYADLCNDGDDLITPAFTACTEVSDTDVIKISAVMKRAAAEIHDLILDSNASSETAGRILGYHKDRIVELRARRDSNH